MAEQQNTIRKTFDFSTEQMERLEAIRVEQNCPTLISTVRYLISFYERNKGLTDTVFHNLNLNKRYLNELRRNDFLILDLLNALCIHLDISAVPSPADAQNRGTALNDAGENLKQYLHEIFTRNRTGDGDLSEGFSSSEYP